MVQQMLRMFSGQVGPPRMGVNDVKSAETYMDIWTVNMKPCYKCVSLQASLGSFVNGNILFIA